MLSGMAEPLLDGFAATGTFLLYCDTAARAYRKPEWLTTTIYRDLPDFI
jgi:hypothetical protein